MSPSLRLFVRRILFLPHDLFNKQKESMVPPKGLVYTGSGDFAKIGEKVINGVIKKSNIHEDSFVLDVGSGIGRLAIPLTKTLGPKGKYHGFDLVKQGVDWCVNNISSKFPNFTFLHTPLQNDLYSNEGSNASNFKFPYEDDYFDVVLVNSVFTHMVGEEVENYLSEISRVLKPTGLSMCTFFLLDDESLSLMNKNEGLTFDHDAGGYVYHSIKVKSANVAYKKDYLMDMIQNNNLKVHSLERGFWYGLDKKTNNNFQDIFYLAKNV